MPTEKPPKACEVQVTNWLAEPDLTLRQKDAKAGRFVMSQMSFPNGDEEKTTGFLIF